MHINKINSYLLFITLMLCMMPVRVSAAKIFIDLPESPVSVGNTSLLKVMIDTEGEEINAVDGSFVYTTSKDITSLNTGGSILNLWPRKPSLQNGVISFTGGATSGVYGNTLNLFTIAIKPSSTKPITIRFEKNTAYLNDGKGTAIPVSGKTLEIPVQISGIQENELASLITEDKTPPESFKIELGNDPSISDGKYFISFFTQDRESGIARYEVIENGKPLVRSGSPYVLQNQNLSGTIEVHAIDNAGNVRTQTLNLGTGISWIKIIMILLVVTILFSVSFFFVFKKDR
jgi:hypothetical protein